MSGTSWALAGSGVLAGAVLAWYIASVSVRLAARDPGARPTPGRVVVTGVLAALVLTAAVVFAGLRPALLAIAWAGGAAVVLGAVDLASHRLPDRVVLPTAAVCAAALLADAVVLGTWPALLRAVLAAAAAFAGGALAASVAPAGLGFGDVKLLGLIGLVLGWVGWAVLAAGVFLGLLAGAVVAVALLVTRRAGWRTALPFGPPLLVGAALALALHGPLPVG